MRWKRKASGQSEQKRPQEQYCRVAGLPPQGRHTATHGWGNKTTVTKMWWDSSHNWGKQWTGKNPSVQVNREEEDEAVLSVTVQLRHTGVLYGGR